MERACNSCGVLRPQSSFVHTTKVHGNGVLDVVWGYMGIGVTTIFAQNVTREKGLLCSSTERWNRSVIIDAVRALKRPKSGRGRPTEISLARANDEHGRNDLLGLLDQRKALRSRHQAEMDILQVVITFSLIFLSSTATAG